MLERTITTLSEITVHGMETFKPVPALLYSWRIHDHSRLTISPLKPRQIFNVFSIHPDAHWTTTTTPQLQMRWWLPWTHGQPEMRWWLPWTHGQPQMRWWLPWTEMLETWNLDPLMWTRIPQQQRKNPSKPRLFFTFKNHWNKELQYNYKTVQWKIVHGELQPAEDKIGVLTDIEQTNWLLEVVPYCMFFAAG